MKNKKSTKDIVGDNPTLILFAFRVGNRHLGLCEKLSIFKVTSYNKFMKTNQNKELINISSILLGDIIGHYYTSLK